MKQYRLIKLVLFILFISFITSCASFPLPDNPWQSLLVISRDVSSQTGERAVSVTTVVLHYRNEDGKKGKFSLSPGKKPLSFAMDPGAYKIENYTIHYQRKEGNDTHTWEDNRTYRLNFYIEKNTVIMFSKTLKATPMKNRDASWVNLIQVSPREKSETLAALRKNEEFKAWSEYDLINFQ